MVCPLCSMMIETRSRLSRGSSERHVSHSQPIEGTPVEVPVPRKVSFIKTVGLCTLTFVLCSSRSFESRTVLRNCKGQRTKHQERSTKNPVQIYFPPMISRPV